MSLTPDQAKCLIRVHPDEDATNGFFVACFQRKTKPGKKSPSKNTLELKINVPKGMEVYSNQFHKEEKQNSAKTEGVTPSDDTTNKNETATTKRKIDHISETEPSKLDKKISKKIAKKLEWKKRQRLQKEARLKAKKAAKKSE